MTALPKPEGDEEIIHLMQAGSVRGLEALLRVHGSEVKGCLRTVFRLPPGDELLEDAVQDAALLVFRAADRLDPRGNLSGYYYTTAWRELSRMLDAQSAQRHKQLWDGAEEEIQAPAGETGERSSLSKRIAAAVEALPLLEREVLMLEIAHDFALKASEVARLLGTTEDSVYSLRRRTKQRLRRLLPGDGTPGER